MPNNHMHTDSKKCRSFLALFFAAGDVRHWGEEITDGWANIRLIGRHDLRRWTGLSGLPEWV